jgi:Short C-terminal domain
VHYTIFLLSLGIFNLTESLKFNGEFLMSLADELSKLGQMLKEGLLSPAEFEQAKQRLLSTTSTSNIASTPPTYHDQTTTATIVIVHTGYKPFIPILTRMSPSNNNLITFSLDGAQFDESLDLNEYRKEISVSMGSHILRADYEEISCRKNFTVNRSGIFEVRLIQNNWSWNIYSWGELRLIS